jgi:hypothetical protein
MTLKVNSDRIFSSQQERMLPKPDVASSSLVARSKKKHQQNGGTYLFNALGER